MEKYTAVFILVIFQICFIPASYATRYSCLRRQQGGMYNFGLFGGSDSSSSEEIGDEEEEEDGGMMLRGTLSCGDVHQARILVTKVIHGNGGFFASCASPNEQCDRVVFSNSLVAEMCDRKTSCAAAAQSLFLPKCGLRSNFVHVEYECVNPWSVFDICHDVTSTATTSEIYTISPPLVPPKASKCECIMNPVDDVSLQVDYIHSNTDNRDCGINYLLIESKSSPNQTAVDAETKVCGRRHVKKKTYHGSLRFTYGTRSRFLNDGFIARISAEGKSNIEIQCGTVFLPGDEASYRGPPPRRPLSDSYLPHRRRFRQGFRNHRRFMPPPYQDPSSNYSSSASGVWESRWDAPARQHPEPLNEPTFNRGPPRDRIDTVAPERNGNIRSRDARLPPNPPLSRNGYFDPPLSPLEMYRRELDLFYEGPRRGRNQDMFFDGPGRNRNLDLFYDGPRRWGPTTPSVRSGRLSRQRENRLEKHPIVGNENSTDATKPIPKLDSSFFSPSNTSDAKPEVKLPAKVEFIGHAATKKRIEGNKQSVSSAGDLPPQELVPPVVNVPPPPPNTNPDILALNRQLSQEKSSGENQNEGQTTEQFVAYAMTGVGVVLIAVGALFVVFRYTRRRKRQKETSFRQNTGRSIEEQPVYTLPSNRPMPSIPTLQSHVNSAYTGSVISVTGQFDKFVGEDSSKEVDEDPYSTVCSQVGSDITNPCYTTPNRETADECVGTSIESRLAISNLYDNNV